jgi:hypothetical protein
MALVVIVMIILTWVAIFGGIGAVISSSSGKSPVLGFALGALFGPIGWLVTWLICRQAGSGDFIDLLDRDSGRAELNTGETTSLLEEDDW